MLRHVGTHVACCASDQHLHTERSSRAMERRKYIIRPASKRAWAIIGPKDFSTRGRRNYSSVLGGAVPVSPRGRIIRKILACDITERLIHPTMRSEEHTSELQSRFDLVCRLLLEKKN